MKKVIQMAFLLQSGYFQFWSDHFRRTKSTKQNYISVLRKFPSFFKKASKTRLILINFMRVVSFPADICLFNDKSWTDFF